MTGNSRHHKPTAFQIVGAGIAIAFAGAGMIDLELEQRIVTLPIYAIVAIAATFITVLWKRDSSPPYFDLGVFCVVVISIYLCYPLLAFLLTGLVWTELS